MRFAAAVSEHPVAATAVGEVVGQVLEAIGSSPDFACCFIADDHVNSAQAIIAAVRELLTPGALLTSSTVSAIGGNQEIEDRAAVALFAGHTGSGGYVPVRFEARPGPDRWVIGGIPDLVDPAEARTLLLVADPATFPTEQLVDDLTRSWPALSIVGGLAAVSPRMGSTRLGLDDAVFGDGAIGLLLPPDLPARSVVSQGCRPIGDPFTITDARDNVALALGGQPAMTRLEHLVERSSPGDRALLAAGVHLGIVIDEHRETFAPGDFLVRSILGAERGTGGIAVAGLPEAGGLQIGSTVQFQVRDATTAHDDLRLALTGPPADAALVFTCIARGMRLFGDSDHDAREVHDAVGRGAVAGMYCSGEVGPVGLRSFVHGYTASVLLLGGRADARGQLG